MGKYDFILDNMWYSFSRVNSFEDCPYNFELTYIFDNYETQVNNFFAEYGTFCHLILEKYFKYELEIWDLVSFYEKEYYNNITTAPPPFPKGMADNYYQRGLNFFDNFEFDRNEYKVLAIEETIFTKIDKYNVIIKPDLRLQKKDTNEIYIYDYKTSDVNKKKELEKAKLQINFYALGVWLYHKQKVKYGVVVGIRDGEFHQFEITNETMQDAKNWFVKSIEQIYKEENFEKGKVQAYFCNNLCGNREICKYRI